MSSTHSSNFNSLNHERVTFNYTGFSSGTMDVCRFNYSLRSGNFLHVWLLLFSRYYNIWHPLSFLPSQWVGLKNSARHSWIVFNEMLPLTIRYRELMTLLPDTLPPYGLHDPDDKEGSTLYCLVVLTPTLHPLWNTTTFGSSLLSKLMRHSLPNRIMNRNLCFLFIFDSSGKKQIPQWC